jgi:GAF domain-containing protein
LASAELAQATGAPLEECVAHYERAMASDGNAFGQWHAMSAELFGRFWLARGFQHLADAMLRQALQGYRTWGAAAPVQRLERVIEAAFGKVPPASRVDAEVSQSERAAQDALDLSSVLKATRVISGEVKTERLLTQLMLTLVENAAAQRGCLVLLDDNERLIVRVRAESALEVPSLRSLPLEAEPNVCAPIVRYVAHTLEHFVIDDALSHPQHGADDGVRERGVRSVLCLPIVSQGRLMAVLYLENNLTAQAFSQERVATLQLIAGQAALFLTNALIYDNLENKVTQRTRELSDKTRQLGAMLDAMQQGLFAVDENLEIQPEYSRALEAILGRGELTGESVSVLFEGGDLGAHAKARTPRLSNVRGSAPLPAVHLAHC